MARHQWAIDRMREGLIGASDPHWRSGLYALAHTHVTSLGTTYPALANRLRSVARDAYATTQATTSERAGVYGDVLAICVGCHAASP